MKALSYLVLTLWLHNLYMKCTLIKWTTNTGNIVIPGLGSYLNTITCACDKKNTSKQSMIIRFLVLAKNNGMTILCNTVNPSVLFYKSSRRLSIDDATALKEQPNIKLA